jgi:hypothetical protein
VELLEEELLLLLLLLVCPFFCLDDDGLVVVVDAEEPLLLLFDAALYFFDKEEEEKMIRASISFIRVASASTMNNPSIRFLSWSLLLLLLLEAVDAAAPTAHRNGVLPVSLLLVFEGVVCTNCLNSIVDAVSSSLFGRSDLLLLLLLNDDEDFLLLPDVIERVVVVVVWLPTQQLEERFLLPIFCKFGAMFRFCLLICSTEQYPSKIFRAKAKEFL